MLADVAIAVNPDDERYQRLIGETAILPIVGRKLRIIADDYVKTEFGTGALKITPGHDPNDFEIGNRHGLPHPTVIGEDGRMEGDDVPERFLGLKTAEAQLAIVAELDDLGLIQRREEYRHTVPFSQRSGARIEPLISLQWFMRMDELARPAIDVVRSGQVKFHPERWTKVYLDWMENIRPWCISRQLWWGHQIPVWYRRGETYVGTTAPDGDGWERDPDVLDTWFSSALWPFATLGWPEQTPELARLLSHRRAQHRPRHHLPLGRAHDHDGPRVHRPDPVQRRLCALDHPGPGPAPHVQVARHRRRPAGR